MNKQYREITSPAVLAPGATEEFNLWFWNELTEMAAQTAEALGDDLIAVVLGGGYGRSEGCVTLYDGMESAYNDVDLFLITTTPLPQGYGKLRHIAEHYEQRLHIAVDFSRPVTLAVIAKWPATLMWQELALGHRVLYGPSDIITARVPNRVLQTLPKVEASRLLLNRGAGLVWAARVAMGLEDSPDLTFVTRNFYKCAQAIADAILLGCGVYRSEPAIKQERLKALAETEPIAGESRALSYFAQGRAFRECPHGQRVITQADLKEIARDWLRVFLWVESMRSGRSFCNAEDYCNWPAKREAGEITLMQGIAANLRRKRVGWKHPRELVYRTLPDAIDELARGGEKFDQAGEAALRRWKDAE